MTALAWLVPAALLLGGLGLVAFLWALRSGQFEDLEGASYRALEDAAGLPVVLNAANEIAVATFLAGRLGFTAIARVIEETMNAYQPGPARTLHEVRVIDAWAREYSQDLARRLELKI